MGCVVSKTLAGSVSEAVTNSRINAEQNKKKAELDRTIHLMILGPGDSGKTTLRKQIANIHGARFSTREARSELAPAVVANLLDGTLEVLKHMPNNKFEFLHEVIQRESESGASRISPNVADALKQIFADEGFATAIEESKSKLTDCFFYYLEEFRTYPVWGGDDWVPTADDCIRARIRTSGVIKDEIKIDGLPFMIYDVGGQRSERRKWMHMFDNITAAIYVCAISEYDTTLFEDNNKNRFEESLDLFNECANSTWLKKATMLLFLNKKDLFLKKFSEQKVSLNASGLFPSAPATNDDPKAAIAWMTSEFQRRSRNKGALYVHVTTATDESNIRTVVNVSKQVILQKDMKRAGFS